MDFGIFLDAQEPCFATAMSELRAGRKRTHWIWYVFPILLGLRESATARRFAVPDAAAARAYFAHDTLGGRLREATAVVHEQVCSRGLPLDALMGSDVDACKLVSSLTLFSGVAAGVPEAVAFRAHAEAVLVATALRGMPRCAFTERALVG